MTIQIPPPPGSSVAPGGQASASLVQVPPPPPLPPPLPPTHGGALLDEHDSRTYNELLGQITATVKPSDVLEHMWIRDIVDHQWDIHQLRRMKPHMVSAEMPGALQEILSYLVKSQCDLPGDYPVYTAAEALAKKWYLKEADAVGRVDYLFSMSPDMSMETVRARAFANALPDLSRLNILVVQAEERRNAALRAIDRHRAAFGRKLRGALHAIDTEFEAIDEK